MSDADCPINFPTSQQLHLFTQNEEPIPIRHDNEAAVGGKENLCLMYLQKKKQK
jgi:hypothetical protein